MITDFKSPETSFLSNFEPATVIYRDRLYQSVEHAFMSAKCDDPKWKDYCANPNISAQDVKREGKTVQLVDDWEKIKIGVMYDCLNSKFSQEPFTSKLHATGIQNLQEGNWWGDRFWGVDLTVNPNIGENMLGRLIMQIRREQRHARSIASKYL